MMSMATIYSATSLGTPSRSQLMMRMGLLTESKARLMSQVEPCISDPDSSASSRALTTCKMAEWHPRCDRNPYWLLERIDCFSQTATILATIMPIQSFLGVSMSWMGRRSDSVASSAAILGLGQRYLICHHGGIRFSCHSCVRLPNASCLVDTFHSFIMLYEQPETPGAEPSFERSMARLNSSYVMGVSKVAFISANT